MSIDVLKKTPLHSLHAALGARLVDFAGWSMPVQYRSIVEEHIATRTHAALFDVSHMARFFFSGRQACAFLDAMVTRRVTDLKPGQIRYGLICNERGGILDDVLVYRLDVHHAGSEYLMVVNAGNRHKIHAWLEQRRDDWPDVQLHDRTEATAMIAVQGPDVVPRMHALFAEGLQDLRYYFCRTTKLSGHEVLVSRTGYTGEDGCELIVPGKLAETIWRTCSDATQGVPAGLGARDTLRLEAGMPLYGHELSESIQPFQADLAFAVNLEDRDFIGRATLAKAVQESPSTRRIGLALQGKRAAREHYSVWSTDREIGEITSGSLSPTLGYPIAMAYLEPEFVEIGGSVDVDIRGTRVPAKVVSLPFYKRKKS